MWPFKRRKPTTKALPPELVVAIENVGCVFRSFVQDEQGDRFPRPLCLNFLGSRPVYLDDQEAVTRLLKSKYPELDDEQIRRALTLFDQRIRLLARDHLDHQALISRGNRRRNSWMSFMEEINPWQS